MSVILSGEQLAKLEEAVNAGDRIAYYSLLADYGHVYGKLALAVVNNDPGGGATASYFITTQAQIEGNPLTSNALANISLQLMQADFAARANAGGAELGYAAIQSYHQQVFGINGLTPNAWTANFPLNYLGTVEEKQALWTTLLTSGSLGSGEAIFAALSGGWINQDPDVIAYLGKLASAGAMGLASSSNEFGGYSVSIAGGGQAIGGTEGNDTETGTQYADVVMGFDGADTLIGASGADRIYGGADDDVLVGGSLNSGFDPSSINYASLETSSHSEWDDGEKDILQGGAGSDIYIVGGGVNAPNVELTDQQVQERGKLDVIDGSDSDFTVYAQWVKDDPDEIQMTVTARLTSGDIAAATAFGDLLSFDTALSTVYYPEDDDKYGSSLVGQKVYDAATKEAILYVASMVNSYTNVLLFGIKNYLTFDPISNTGWRIEGNNNDNGDLGGTDGDDSVFARGGDDSIDASKHGGGSDRYDGGDGNDTISYASSAENLTISYDSLWGEFSVTGSGGESDTFTGIERIIGGSGTDSISGSDADETFSGGGGNDTLNGEGGVNTIDFSIHTSSVTVQFTATGEGSAAGSQSGQDSFTHIQNIIGSQGDDTITADGANNVIDGQNGSDQIDGGAGFDTVSFLNTIASYTIIAASSGYLQIWDYAYTDTIIDVEAFSFAGVAYTYSAVQAAAAAVTSGTSGDDEITGSNADDAIFGGAGNDTVSGLAGNDLIYGDDGDDVISVGDGINNINGGNGSDTVIISGAQSDFSITIQSDHSILVSGSGITNRIADVEWIAFDAPDGQDDTNLDVAYFIESNSSTTITGTGSNDPLTGTAGHDTIHGLAGNDTISGLEGDDTIEGGVGDDNLNGNWGSDIYVFNAGDGNDAIEDWDNPEATDVLELGAGIEAESVSVERGTAGFWDIILNFGTAGSVTIRSGFYTTSTVIEQVKFDDGTLWSLAALQQRFLAQSATSGNDEIYGFLENDVIRGGAGADSIDGLSGNDTLSGEAGDDVLIGEDGNDTLTGGVGADTLVGNGDSDIYVYALGDGHDYLNDGSNNSSDIDVLRLTDLNQADVDFRRSGLSLIMTVQATGETIFINNQFSPDQGGHWGVERIAFADGSSWDNQRISDIGWIRGTAGNDNLVGTWRQEILAGGAGDDSLTGDWGDDTYIFNAGDGNDTIQDWDNSEATDVLQLGAGIEAGSVAIGRGTSGFWDIVLNFGTAGSVTITNGFYGASTVIEEVRFADDTVWTLDDLQIMHLQQAVTAGADTIYGFIDRDDVMEGGGGNDSLTGFSGNDTLQGGAGDDSLSGDDGNDILIGGAGNDGMAGGAGNDAFVFRPGFGLDTIADFTAGAETEDVLEFDNTLFANFEAVLAAASQVGSDTVVAFDAANTVTLKNVALANLHADDVRFVA